MIRAAGKDKDGRPFMILGLSEMNLQKLREGQPIMFDAKALGFDGKVTILYGTTEEGIAEMLVDPE